MNPQQRGDAKRLIPQTPPARLPEEDMLTRLKSDKSYRRNASLTRSLLYHPQRLFTSGAPSRLLPLRAVRELRYRMIAVVTSLALLLGMVNFAPLALFSLAKKASASGTSAPDYNWLATSGTDGSAEHPYEITSAAQLHSLAVLVNELREPESTLSVKINAVDYLLGPGLENNRAPAANALPLLAPADIPVESSPPPSTLPTESPSVAPSESPSAPPTGTPSAEPGESPSAPPTGTPSAEPSETPSVPPAESPTAEPSETPSVPPAESPTAEPTETPAESPVPSASEEIVLAALSVPLAAVPDFSAPSQGTDVPAPSAADPAPDPEPSVSDPEPEPSVSDPEPSATDAAPAPSAPDPEPEPSAPAPSATDTDPEPEPSAVEPEPSPEPTASPSPSVPATELPKAPGNSGLLVEAAGPYTLKVPIGLAGWHFKLKNDLSLDKYASISLDGLILTRWLPIGILEGLSSDGGLSGAPFLGVFDGGGNTISSFYYTLDPSSTMAGYGLFGYVGDTGTVRNLTVRTAKVLEGGVTEPIAWSLSTLKKVDGDKIVDVSAPLGNKSFAVGVLAAAASGTLENCTVTQAELSYDYQAATTAATVSVGGLVGVSQGGSFTDCTFLGKIGNTPSDSDVSNATAKDNYALQQVGGIVGGLYNSSMTRCAAGVDIDIYNGGVTGKSGGVGGLFGYGTGVGEIDSCFTTGVVRTCHDGGGLAGNAGVTKVTSSYSTVTLGKTAKTQRGADANLAIHPHEAMGGLFGATTVATAFENVYFAGGLLEPQFGALVGRLQAGGAFTGVGVDAGQAPHRPFKEPATTPVEVTVARNLAGFLPPEPPPEGAQPSDWVSLTGSQPQLAWAVNGTNATATVKALSAAAAKAWIAPTADNAYSGVKADNTPDNEYSLYRMKDSAIGDTLGGLSLRESVYKNSSGSPIGGVYTGSVTVDGVAVPAVRCAMSALNQTEGRANVITNGSQLLGFADRVNLAGGGYLDGVFVIDGTDGTDGTVDASANPLANYANGKPFCGSLVGHNAGNIKNLTFTIANSVGMLCTVYRGTFKDFTLTDVALKAGVTASGGYFGALAGQVMGVTASNVTVNGFSYQYSTTGNTGGHDVNHTAIGALFGSAIGTPFLVKDCTVSGMDVNISTSATETKVTVGGILGKISSSGDFSFTDCTVDTSIVFAFTGGGQVKPDQNAAPSAGGIVGYDNTGGKAVLTNCHVTGRLEAGNTGGMLGRCRYYALTDCTFTGTIATAAGISADASITGTSSGGLIAFPEHPGGGGPITGCAVLGHIKGTGSAGGLIGTLYSGGTTTAITNSYVSGVMETTSGAAGGLVGFTKLDSSKLAIKTSYFAGQVDGATRGALVGSGSSLTDAAFQGALYDNTLVKGGVSTVGDVAAGNDCEAGPEDARWGTLFNAAPWVIDSTGYHYPQLSGTGTADFKHHSTLKLFRLIGTSESLYDVKPIDQFKTVLPAGVTATPDSGAPFTPGSAVTDPQGYTSTPYTPKASTVSAGTLTLKYSGLGQPSSLSIPYTVGIKLFDHGSGKQTDPFIIPDVDTLYTFKTYVELGLDTSGTYYIISGADQDAQDNYLYPSVVIDMSGEPFWSGISQAFSGHLTGCITDLVPAKLPSDGEGMRSSVIGLTGQGSTDATSGTWSAGFFSGLTGTAVVSDLMLTMSITGPDSLTNASSAAGILSASATGGTVRNVWVEGSITANRTASVGGLIGYSNLASGGQLHLSNIYSDVSIGGIGGSGERTSGAGGLLGRLRADATSSSAPVSVSIAQCATYGSLTDWGAAGGLIGFLDSEKLTLSIKDCLSLSVFTDGKVSLFSSLGGLIGSIRNVRSGDTVVDSSYYAGESYVLSGPARVVGGLAGRVCADTSYKDTPDPKDSPNDFTDLTFKDCVYNRDANQQDPAILRVYQAGSWADQGSRQWPDADHGLTHPDGQPDAPDNVSYGTRFFLDGSAFGMSQGPESTANQMVQGLSWPTNGSWTFIDGLFPKLNWTTEYPAPSSDALLTKHIAVHYTPALEENTSTNVYVRYKSDTQSATLAPTSTANLRATYNGLMAVSTSKGPMQAVDILLGGVKVRTVYITPSVMGRGIRDVSSYTINPDGMWGTGREWTVYNADALAGLSTIYSDATVDFNNVSVPDAAHRPGAQSTDRIILGRDIDLSIYSGMERQQSWKPADMERYQLWKPVGSDTHPFNITLDGMGHTLSNLALNPFLAEHDAAGTHYSYTNLVSPLGLFGTINGGTVKNLVLAGTESTAEVPIYQRAGIRVGMGTTAAGTLAATVINGTLENCLVSVPVYTLGNTPRAVKAGDTEDWSGVRYLGVGAGVPLGGLVGQVTGTALIKNCAYTGYVYGAAASVRPDATDVTPPTNPVGGPVGGLVGEVTSSGSLTVARSYMAGLVDGGTAGALVGSSTGAVALTDDVSYDQNAVGGSVPALGLGSATGEAATQVPAEMGEDWVPATPAGLYPVQEGLSTSTDSLAARLRVTLSPHASSTVSGLMEHTGDGATLIYSEPLQPVVAAIPGQVAVTENRFEKTVDGLTQLELRQGGYARRVLVNVRCWYDDMTPETTPEGQVIRHYTVTTAEELWELGQIVNGTIGSSADSKVGHVHTPEGGFDDFTNAVIHFNGDVDLSTLMDTTESASTKRPWVPIGLTHPFAGTFLGGGHAVSGMEVSGTVAGLFGTVAGSVQDLLVTNAALSLSPDASGAVGGLLCGTLAAGGQLLNCGTSGTAQSGGNAVLGGLVGQNQGSVVGCFSTAELTGSATHLGGIAGGNSGSINMSYFTGYANAISANAVGGIAGDNSGTVSDCYVSAYLDGQTVYHLAKNASGAYDGRHTSKGTGGGSRQDGEALTMGTGWSANTGTYYPIPGPFTTLPLSGTPLAQAAGLAAAIFTFGGTASPNYLRFSSVSVGGMESTLHGLRSGTPALLSVSGNEARPIPDASGDVVLRLGLLKEEQELGFLRPCWLTIPTTLAVAYRFNWGELIQTHYKPEDPNALVRLNAGYNTTVTTGGSAKLIRTTDDWQAFVSAANANGGEGTKGQIYVLDHDLNFNYSKIPTVTAPFYGTFHGGNHTLANFNATAPLFAEVAQGGKVEFLAISNGTLAMSGNGDFSAALLAGVNRGRITNVAAEGCAVDATQSRAAATFVGGLVGQNYGTLDSSYFYVAALSGQHQVTATVPAGTQPAALRMGGLVGYNGGTISGCYVAAALTIVGVGDTPYNYCSALVGRNEGAILYTYWKSSFDFDAEGGVILTSYRNGDGTWVPGKDLFMGNSPTETTARWLSADSYGGAYYYDETAKRLKLFSFELIKYDLTAIFGSPEEQYLMLGLQFGAGDNAMASNAVCSWKDYLLPNFANLPFTSSLSVRLPLLSDKLTYSLSTAHVIRKNLPATDPDYETAEPLRSMGTATITPSSQGGYHVSGLGENTTRVILDITLTTLTQDAAPWGVYRSESTLPKNP